MPVSMHVSAAAPRLSARARPTQVAVLEMATVSHMPTRWQMKDSSLSRARRSVTQSLPHESSTNVKKKIRRTRVRFQAVEVMKDTGKLSKSLPREFINQQAPLEKEET
jgi:hypothetical protein